MITEHWTSARGPYTGHSINIYDRVTGQWDQFYVGLHRRGDALRRRASRRRHAPRRSRNVSAASDAQRRIAHDLYTEHDGTVRQHGETSADGVTWTTDYDFIYRRRTA